MEIPGQLRQCTRSRRKLNWQQCEKGVYPFHDGKLEDFEPVFEDLIKVNFCPSLDRGLRLDQYL